MFVIRSVGGEAMEMIANCLKGLLTHTCTDANLIGKFKAEGKLNKYEWHFHKSENISIRVETIQMHAHVL